MVFNDVASLLVEDTMTGFIAPREKLFGHMDRLHEIQTTGSTSAPINVEVDLSNRCSLGCSWCHFAYTHTRGPLAGKRDKPAGAVAGGDLMETHMAHNLVEELVALGARSLTWTGGGEPTLHPDFDLIVQFAKGRIKQGLYTHGGHLTTSRAQILKEEMTFVYVSLDAADADAYKRDKGVDRFAAACEGVRELVRADGPATVGCGFLVTHQNYRDVGAMADLAESLGADYAQFRPTILYDQQHPDTPAENTSWMTDAIAAINKARYYNPQLVVADTERFRMYQNWQGHGYETCWWSTLQTAVTPNGKVWACVNKREHAGAELGDLTIESFADLWARHSAVPVADDCRVMCRGHLPNLALDEVMSTRLHPEFV